MEREVSALEQAVAAFLYELNRLLTPALHQRWVPLVGGFTVEITGRRMHQSWREIRATIRPRQWPKGCFITIRAFPGLDDGLQIAEGRIYADHLGIDTSFRGGQWPDDEKLRKSLEHLTHATPAATPEKSLFERR